VFETGKFYNIRMIEGNLEITYGSMEAIKVEMPLVQFKHDGEGTFIVNTHSANFVRAKELNEPVGYASIDEIVDPEFLAEIMNRDKQQ